MSNKSVIRRSIGQTLSLVGSSEAFTKRVIIWTLPLSMAIAGLYDSNRFETSSWSWMLIAIAAHMTAAVVMTGLRLLFLPKYYQKPKPLITLFIFVVGSVIRAVLIGHMALAIGLADVNELVYRAVSGGLLGTLTLSVVTILAAITKEYSDAQLQLITDRKALLTARNTAEKLINEKRSEINKIMRESIEPSLLEISRNLKDSTAQDSSSLRESATQISEFISKTIRPLSSELHTRQVVKVAQVPEIRMKPKLVLVPKTIVISEVLSPVALFAIWCLPNVTALFPVVGAMALPLALLFYSPMLLLQSLIVKLPISRRPIEGKRGLLLLALIYATTWVGVIPLSQAFGVNLIQELDLIPALIFGPLVIGMLLSYGFLTDNNRLTFQGELILANMELERELNRTAQEIWLLRQRAAQMLHGSVQSSLTAANMRILGAPSVTENLLQTVRQDITRASIAVTNFESEHIDIGTALAELTQLWSGICEIKLVATDKSLDHISQDQTTARCVNEIVKECVSNAIRHGKAKQINIQIIENANHTLQVIVANDGLIEVLGPDGVGSAIFDEITMKWERKISNQQLVFNAVVACN